MKPIILQTLQLTLIGDNAKLAEAHSTLVELAKNHGKFALIQATVSPLWKLSMIILLISQSNKLL